MKEIKRVEGQSLYLKIFQAIEFDCTIFIYLDKNNKIISMNYHWGTDTIKPNFMEFNGSGEITRLYNLFLGINKTHSPKIYDLVIGAHSIISKRDLRISELETSLAEEKLKNSNMLGKVNKVLSLTKDLV